MLAVGLAAIVAIAFDPGRAVAVTINSEAELRAAFGDPGETEITFGADVSLTECSPGTLLRPAGAGALIVEGAGFTLTQTCAGERVITNEGGDLEVRDLTITGGSLDAGDDAGYGGGIMSEGPLVLARSQVDGNRADGLLGGFGGGVAALSTLRLESTVVTGNSAGGGRDVFSGTGGGVYSEGVTEVVGSTVADNTAEGAPGDGGRGGGLRTVERLLLERSTVSGNTAAAGTGSGGGTFGGAVSDGAFDVINSTVHANTAAGPMSRHGGVNAAGVLRLVYSAVTANSAELGSANVVFKDRDRSTASVVAEAQGGAPSCDAAVGVSGGYNFGGDASCGFTAGTDVQDAGDPGLGALGGVDMPVRTPNPDSPLVDAIPAGDCFTGDAAAITGDQLGLDRPQGDGCDIGPVELVQVPPTTDPTVPPTEPTVPSTEPTVPATEPTEPTTPDTTAVPTTSPGSTVPSGGGGTTSTEPPGDPSGPLPATGTTIAAILLIAAGLVTAGFIVRRKSRTRISPAD